MRWRGRFRRRDGEPQRRPEPEPPPLVCRTCATFGSIRALVSHAGWHPVTATFQRPGDGYITFRYEGGVFYPSDAPVTVLGAKCFNCGDRADSMRELLVDNPRAVDHAVETILTEGERDATL